MRGGASGATLLFDAAGLTAFAAARPSERLRALLAEAHRGNGRSSSRRSFAQRWPVAGPALGRSRSPSLARPPAGRAPPFASSIRNFTLARQVGAILEAVRARSDQIVETRVVAVCVPYGAGLVVTSDPDDISKLAAAVPAARIRTAEIRTAEI